MEPILSKKADIWALGNLMFSLFCCEDYLNLLQMKSSEYRRAALNGTIVRNIIFLRRSIQILYTSMLELEADKRPGIRDIADAFSVPLVTSDPNMDDEPVKKKNPEYDNVIKTDDKKNEPTPKKQLYEYDNVPKPDPNAPKDDTKTDSKRESKTETKLDGSKGEDSDAKPEPNKKI